jgi:HK97 family phage major capsid protein
VRTPAQREFTRLADFLRAVVIAARDGIIDRRLQRAPTGLSEGVSADGGFLVPQVFAEDIVGSIYKTGVLAGGCDRRTTAQPIADVQLRAVDESSRLDGSRYGGVLAYWSAEAAAITSTFPRWRRVGFSANKIIGIGYSTRELAEDSDLFEAELRSAFGEELAFKLEQAIVAGSGSGQPVGIIGSPCAIIIAKEIGQAASIVSENITNMYDVLVADCLPRAVWLINPDVAPKLRNLSQVVGTAGGPLWAWNGDGPYPRLLGLPVIATEHNPAIGSAGDVVLADLSQYRIVDQAPNSAISMDAAFVSDQIVFRVTYRVDGKGKYSSPITPANSSTQRSPFVVLGARP